MSLDKLRAIVERLTANRIYYAKHRCKVVQQHGDDTVDIIPDNERLRARGLTHVPIRHGIPGLRVRVRAESECLLGFEGGNPDVPYVSLWTAGSVEQIILGEGTQGVARIGDPVQVFWPPANVIAGTLNGLPFAATMLITTPSAGIITAGSQKVFAG